MEQSKPKTILIVDDNEAIRLAIAEIVESYGWAVLEASNATSGLRVFRSQLPDIVLTDVVMGGLDGFELTSEIKSISPQTPVIIMTAFNDPHLRGKARDVGASEFLHKPFKPEELLAALNRSLGNSAGKKEL